NNLKNTKRETRNVIYPMLIHGVINGISIVPVILIEGTELATLYEIFYYTVIIGIGSIYLLYLFWCILKDSKAFKIKNIGFKEVIINRGFAGYLIISSGLLLLHTISSVFFQVISVLIITPITLIFLLIITRKTEFRRRESLESQMSQETSLIS
ncbi:MAG: hypothetical protein ACFFB5_23120, partial [Promethearchaeota archaeon]